MDFVLLNKMIDEFYADLKEQKNATQAEEYAKEQQETALSERMYPDYEQLSEDLG